MYIGSKKLTKAKILVHPPGPLPHTRHVLVPEQGSNDRRK